MTSTTWRESNESRLVDQLLTRTISFQNQMVKVQLMLNPTNPKYVNFGQEFLLENLKKKKETDRRKNMSKILTY